MLWTALRRPAGHVLVSCPGEHFSSQSNTQIFHSGPLATNVQLPFICKLHWAPRITVHWLGSGLSHRSDLKSAEIMNRPPSSYGSRPTASVCWILQLFSS